MNLKAKLGSNGFARNTSFINTILMLVTLIAYIIYGVTYSYFDTVVCGFMVAAILLSAVHFLVDSKAAQVCNLLEVMCISGGVALFVLNSYPVWADELNGITMYGSRGGLTPVIALLVLQFAAVILGIVSCFVPEKEGK